MVAGLGGSYGSQTEFSPNRQVGKFQYAAGVGSRSVSGGQPDFAGYDSYLKNAQASGTLEHDNGDSMTYKFPDGTSQSFSRQDKSMTQYGAWG